MSASQVYERSRFANELGAAVNVSPNAAPVLDAIGFDRKRARLVKVMEGKQFDGATLETNSSGRYDDFKSRFHAPLALDPPDGVTPATLHLSSPVASIDCEAGLLKLQDGTELQKDLIVGTGGLHSVVARSVLGTDFPVGVVNECAYRFLIPTSKLLGNPITKPLFQEDVETFHVVTGSDRRLRVNSPTPQPSRSIVSCFRRRVLLILTDRLEPSTSSHVQNFVALHQSSVYKKGLAANEDWHGGGNVDDLLETYSGFHPSLVEICRHSPDYASLWLKTLRDLSDMAAGWISNAEDLKLWRHAYRGPIRQWARGKAILIGDAAHPMLPLSSIL
ncbi:Putative FAD/NAD(P)-binding domain superfamily [Colletotrichum destructivum]|uniref:FAD/NAD(P)-binding domain superfamily n=1 Tax=Colletotrichum destructivum TaxID=34406 RepID=A0AAX4J4B3_9PEZI|nr:Putative FAD/NAD(P)-binding domain superfamily [Colletotrichum destructivum]